MVDWFDTLIAVGIYVVNVRNVGLIFSSNIDGTIFCVDRRDRNS